MTSQLLSNPLVLQLSLQVYAIKKTLSNYGKPHVRKDDKGQSLVEGEDTDEAVQALALYAVYIVAATAFLSGGVTMWFYSSYLLDFSTFCLWIMAIVIAFQKFSLQLLGDLRGQHNQLREKCNVLAGENDKLTSNINDFEAQLGRLSDVEEGLGKIAEKSGTETKRLVDLVNENGELQLQVKKILEKQIMQQIVDVVVSSDKDGNFTLAPQETQMLKVRLNGMEGIKFNEATFDKMIASDQNELTVSDVMNILRNLLDDEVPEADNVFVLQPETLIAKKSGVRSLLPF